MQKRSIGFIKENNKQNQIWKWEPNAPLIDYVVWGV